MKHLFYTGLLTLMLCLQTVAESSPRIALVAPEKLAAVNLDAVTNYLQTILQAHDLTPAITLIRYPQKTLMMWSYLPSEKMPAEQLAGHSYVFSFEPADIINTYPEFAFEGLRRLHELAPQASVFAVLIAPPSKTFRDKTPFDIAPNIYRIADGTDTTVTPAALAWWQIIKDNRFDKTTVNRRTAAEFTYALLLANDILQDVPSRGYPQELVPFGAEMQTSIRKTLSSHSREKWYAGPWLGTVYRRAHPPATLAVKAIGGDYEDALARELNILASALQIPTTPANSNANDFFFGRYHALPPTPAPGENQPFTAVFNRPLSTDGPALAELEVAGLEDYLLSGYMTAKRAGYSYIPLHIAFARLTAAQPKINIAKGPAPTTAAAHLGAAMLLGAAQRVESLPADADVTLNACQETGLTTLRELSALQSDLNTLRVQPLEKPGTYAITLAKKPKANVTVHIAPMPTTPALPGDVAEHTKVSDRTITFTPDNYAAPQTITITSRAKDLPSNAFANIGLVTQSKDPRTEGLSHRLITRFTK